MCNVAIIILNNHHVINISNFAWNMYGYNFDD